MVTTTANDELQPRGTIDGDAAENADADDGDADAYALGLLAVLQSFSYTQVLLQSVPHHHPDHTHHKPHKATLGIGWFLNRP